MTEGVKKCVAVFGSFEKSMAVWHFLSIGHTASKCGVYALARRENRAARRIAHRFAFPPQDARRIAHRHAPLHLSTTGRSARAPYTLSVGAARRLALKLQQRSSGHRWFMAISAKCCGKKNRDFFAEKRFFLQNKN